MEAVEPRAGTGPIDPNELVRANLRFAAHVARDYVGRGLSFDDLVNAARLGLVEASRRFEPARGIPFLGYAAWWVRKEILQALASETRVVRIPRARYREMLREDGPGRVLPILNLDAVRRTDDDDGPTVEPEPCTERFTPEDALLRSDVATTVLAEVDGLEPRARAVLVRRFGLRGAPRETLETIGASMGVSREWVRRIEARALDRLRSRLVHRLRPRGRHADAMLRPGDRGESLVDCVV